MKTGGQPQERDSERDIPVPARAGVAHANHKGSVKEAGVATGLRAPCRGTAKGSVPHPTPPHAGGGLGSRHGSCSSHSGGAPARPSGARGAPRLQEEAGCPGQPCSSELRPGTLTGQEELAGEAASSEQVQARLCFGTGFVNIIDRKE